MPVQVYMAPSFVTLSDDQSKLPRHEHEDAAKAEYLRQRARHSDDPKLLVRAASLVLFTDLFNDHTAVDRRQATQEARRWLQRAASLGSAAANALLGHVFAYGLADQQVNISAATKHYLLAFNSSTSPSSTVSQVKHQRVRADPVPSGRSEAANGLGLLHMNGVGGVPIDYERAMAYFQVAVRTGHAEAVSNAAHLMRHADPRRAKEYLEAATRVGHLRSTFRLARMLETQQDGTCEEIVELYKRVAEQSDGGRRLLQRAYAAYMSGHVGAARRLFLVVAEMGYAVAESNAAWLIERYGVTGNELILGDQNRSARASDVYRRLVHRGVLQKNADALVRAGDLAFDERKILHAKRFYERAIESSPRHARALYSLGFLAEHSLLSTGTTPDADDKDAWRHRDDELARAADFYGRARQSEPQLRVVMYLLELKVALKRVGLWLLARLATHDMHHVITAASPSQPLTPSTMGTNRRYDPLASREESGPTFEAALAFDGQPTSRVLVETSESVFLAEWTMDTWLRIDSSGEQQQMQRVPQALFEAAGGLVRLELCMITAGEWNLCVRSNVAGKQSLVLSTSVKLYPERWHHVTIAAGACNSRTNMRIAVVYVDGHAVDRVQLPGFPLVRQQGGGVVAIGNIHPRSPFSSHAAAFRGQLLRFRVWPIALLHADVATLGERGSEPIFQRAIELSVDVRRQENSVLNKQRAVHEAQGVLPLMTRVPPRNGDGTES
ncbi:hypothetical protein ATCC90586_002723 [Pythium insidiosum]|nr:hypothetical protein ATCC90586_002723 [Pythium insidiosum]